MGLIIHGIPRYLLVSAASVVPRTASSFVGCFRCLSSGEVATLKTQRVCPQCPASPALKVLLSLHPCHAPFSGEDYCSTFAAWREVFWQFDNSASAEIVNIQVFDCLKTGTVKRLCPSPSPFGKTTFSNRATSTSSKWRQGILGSAWRLCPCFALFAERSQLHLQYVSLSVHTIIWSNVGSV